MRMNEGTHPSKYKERGHARDAGATFKHQVDRGKNELKSGEERRLVTVTAVWHDKLSGNMSDENRTVHIPRCVVPAHLSAAGIRVATVLECDVNLRWNKRGQPQAVRVIRIVST